MSFYSSPIYGGNIITPNTNGLQNEEVITRILKMSVNKEFDISIFTKCQMTSDVKSAISDIYVSLNKDKSISKELYNESLVTALSRMGVNLNKDSKFRNEIYSYINQLKKNSYNNKYEIKSRNDHLISNNIESEKKELNVTISDKDQETKNIVKTNQTLNILHAYASQRP